MTSAISQTFSLQTDIICKLCENLPLKDLKRLRAVNRFMRNCVDEYLQSQWDIYKEYKWSFYGAGKVLDQIEGASLALVQKVEVFSRMIWKDKTVKISPFFLNKKAQEVWRFKMPALFLIKKAYVAKLVVYPFF